MKIVQHLTTQQKYTDLEVHVRVVEADGARFVDIRDFVPSSKTYGRGIMLPLDNPNTVRQVAQAVAMSEGVIA